MPPIEGEEMGEVYSVHIIKNDGDWECPTEIYGTITAKDSEGTQFIYSRTEENAQTIKAGDNALLLTGPERFILGYDLMRIKLDLTLKDKNRDDDIIRGDITWWLSDFSTRVKGQVIESNFYSKYGTMAIVKYAVFDLALTSTVQVTFIKGGPAQFYGGLTACCSNISEKIVLLHTAKDEPFDVCDGQQIKLSRSVLAVRSGFPLVIAADLFDNSNGSEIFNGSIRFDPQLSGTTDNYFRSELYEIQVSVTWEAVIDYRKYCTATPEELAILRERQKRLLSKNPKMVLCQYLKERRDKEVEKDQLELDRKRGRHGL